MHTGALVPRRGTMPAFRAPVGASMIAISLEYRLAQYSHAHKRIAAPLLEQEGHRYYLGPSDGRFLGDECTSS